MKVDAKGYYGMLALAELAQRYKSRGPLQVREIARQRQIPREYLGQIMVQLKKAGLVHGARGPGGGYVLARPPDTITMKEMLTVLGGPFVGMDLKSRGRRLAFSSVSQRVIETWAKGVTAFEKILEETTLADLCRPEDKSYMYHI
jgi:Rrf2 family protein